MHSMMAKPHKSMESYAEGGMCMAHGKAGCSACGDDDIVDRIMLKMSGGGMVDRDDMTADEEPNEFDEMKLRGEPESLGEGDDEIGDKAEDDDRHDIVSRIMRSLSKRDRMPRPA